MTDDLAPAGARIRRLRRLRRLTQEELGELAGLHPSYVGQVERGQRTPSVRTIEAMARALGIDPAHLLRTTDDPDSPIEDLLALVAAATPQQVRLITRIAETVLSTDYQIEGGRESAEGGRTASPPKPSK